MNKCLTWKPFLYYYICILPGCIDVGRKRLTSMLPWRPWTLISASFARLGSGAGSPRLTTARRGFLPLLHRELVLLVETGLMMNYVLAYGPCLFLWHPWTRMCYVFPHGLGCFLLHPWSSVFFLWKWQVSLGREWQVSLGRCGRYLSLSISLRLLLVFTWRMHLKENKK